MSLLKEILRGIKLNPKLNMPMLEYFAQCVLIRKTSSPQKGKHQIPWKAFTKFYNVIYCGKKN